MTHLIVTTKTGVEVAHENATFVEDTETHYLRIMSDGNLVAVYREWADVRTFTPHVQD